MTWPRSHWIPLDNWRDLSCLGEVGANYRFVRHWHKAGGYGESRDEALICVTAIFASFQPSIAALHLRIPGIAWIEQDFEIDVRFLIAFERLVDRPFRQVNYGPTPPAQHPCGQAIIPGFAHISEMGGGWCGLQGEVSINLLSGLRIVRAWGPVSV